MNRFKILKTPELKPCFAPVEKTKKTVQGLFSTIGVTGAQGFRGATGAQGLFSTIGVTGAQGYPGVSLLPCQQQVLECAQDLRAMHGIVMPEQG